MLPINNLSRLQAEDKIYDILPFVSKYFTNQDSVPFLTVKEFCRKVCDLDHLPEVEILKLELERSYRNRCISLLSDVLKVERNTILLWGSSLKFSRMPIYYQKLLSIYWENYRLFSENQRLNKKDSNRDINKYFCQKDISTLSAREFCQRAFNLHTLPEDKILTCEIQRNYRKNCILLLGKLFQLHPQAIRNWGRDINFRQMPAYYQKFLGIYWENYELFSANQRLKKLQTF